MKLKHATNTKNANVNDNVNDNVNANANSTTKGTAFCETLVVDVDDAFKPFAREVSKICNSLNKDELIINKDSNYNARNNILFPPFQVSQENPLESLIDILNKQPLSKTPVLLESFMVQYIGNAGVGQGVARNFFSECIKQCEDELFQQVEGSDLYDLNDIKIKRKLKGDDIQIKRKLKVLGFLMGIMVYNNIAFSFKVKRALVHKCLYNGKSRKDASLFVYHMLEDPEGTTSMINLMKTPIYIEASDLDFEDIGQAKQPVTIRNFREFILAREESELPEAYKLVAQGFALSGFDKMLKGNNVAAIHKSLCMQEMTEETRKSFIKQIDFGPSVPTSVKTWLTDIILTIDQDLLRKFIHFWSAAYGINKDRTYQVVEGARVITKQVCPLLESHTCYYQLVLPKGIESKEKLLEMLQTSVGYVSKGIALYGGRNRGTEYIKYKKRKYVVHKGSRGGKYIISKGEKIYVKQIQ
jgi:hypothetical protein